MQKRIYMILLPMVFASKDACTCIIVLHLCYRKTKIKVHGLAYPNPVRTEVQKDGIFT